MVKIKNPIIAALDVPTAEQAWKLAEQIAPAVGAFKIGKELFVAAGPDIVKKIRGTGAAVFLDLKFHDIPNTVAKAIATATRLDVQMTTIHTSGGSEMMRVAEKSAQDTAKILGLPAPLVLGVTVLTRSGIFRWTQVVQSTVPSSKSCQRNDSRSLSALGVPVPCSGMSPLAKPTVTSQDHYMVTLRRTCGEQTVPYGRAVALRLDAPSLSAPRARIGR